MRALSWGPAGTTIGEGLDLDARPGQAIALMGPNGSGKTTLLRTLLGRLAPTAGSVELEGRDVRDWPARDLSSHLGYVAQQPPAVAGYRTMDWVLLARTARLRLGAAPSVEDREAARVALAAAGIEAFADASLDAMSGGERQLAAIARALAQGGRVLLLDEPCASLDFGNRARVLEALAALCRGGNTVIFATHDPGEARALAGEVVLLTRGARAQRLPVGEALDPTRLAELFGVDPRVLQALRG
ncbi:MAG: ABC transporter ATP-binding protein [Gammaproteobacteria bacterium]